ncbi:MAG: 1-phosphofructokinase [Mycobacteriaceae bacterium]|nr:1-phosphofructokinase [Mycobacteriaceae bacterium]
MPGIVTLTVNPTVDLTFEVPGLVCEGKSRAVQRNVQAGGGGINVARYVQRLGAAAIAVHTRGAETGEWLNRLLDTEGIRHIGVPVAEPTRVGVVVDDVGAGHSVHIVPPGPTLTEVEGGRCIETVYDALEPGGFLVITGSLPPGLPDDYFTDLIRQANDREVRVLHDICGEPLRKALGERAFLARLDRTAASGLIDRPVASFADAHAAARRVLDLGGADIAVATVGPLGTVCVTRDVAVRIPAPPLPRPARSVTCAGDSLVATITVRLAAGDDPVTACRHGVAAAAATVMLPGTGSFRLPDLAALLPHIQPEPLPT